MRSLRKNLEAVPGNHSIDSLQKTAILGTSHIIRKVLQCEAWSVSGGDQRWFKRSTGKKCLWQETCILYNNNNKLQLGCQPVAVVILHVYKIWNWLLINLSRGGATWEACSGNLECWEPSQHLLIDTGKPRKTCGFLKHSYTSPLCTLRSVAVADNVTSFWERCELIQMIKWRSICIPSAAYSKKFATITLVCYLPVNYLRVTK